MKREPPPRFKDVEIDGVIYRIPAHDVLEQAFEQSPPLDPERKPISIAASMLQWNDKRIWVQSQARGELLSIDTAALLELAAVDPWPRFTLGWRYGGYRSDELFGAVRGHEAELGARVTALADELGVSRSGLVKRGWIDAPDAEWEQVAALPDDVPRTQGEGAFRTSALAKVPEPVVARRSPRTSTEALLGWLASGPDRPWRRQPIEIVATEEYVYWRAPDGVFRLPLGALRAILVGRARDRIAIFGRRMQLLITHRAECPLVEYLERRCKR